MNTVGIIAEYNPFHNGHLYQIEQIKKSTGAQNIVIAMSGDYVQRGLPAWTDKYLRTKMALSCGAACVFELPASFATASAETFAMAGISLFTSLSFVDGICFGCESSELALLQEIAAFLVKPSKEFEQTVANCIAKGDSYPVARQKALCSIFSSQKEACAALLSAPNNILAIEYLKAISLLDSPLIPIPILRNGSGYHSQKLSGAFSSASAIRIKSFEEPKKFLTSIAAAVPQNVTSLLEQYPNHYPITENYFSSLLYYRLSNLTEKDKNILDMTDEIFHRIKNQFPAYAGYSQFIAQTKTKQYTYSRISRILLRCLLHIENPLFQKQAEGLIPAPFVPYARLLGFLRGKSSILRIQAKIPIITKPADGLQNITNYYADTEEAFPGFLSYALWMYQKDIYASNLYRQVQKNALGCSRPDEYHSQPVIWK